MKQIPQDDLCFPISDNKTEEREGLLIAQGQVDLEGPEALESAAGSPEIKVCDLSHSPNCFSSFQCKLPSFKAIFLLYAKVTGKA